MAAPCFTNEFELEVKEVGSKLSVPPSSTMELLDLLNKAKDLMSYVAQASCSSMQEALSPSMGALISHELLRLSDVDFKFSVASCLSEITRVTAPEKRYHDELMKAHMNNEYSEVLVGRRIKVWWPLDQMYYDGAIAAFDPSENRHTVLGACCMLLIKSRNDHV